MASKNILTLDDTDPKQLTIEQLRERLRPSDALDVLQEVQDTLADQWENLSKNQIDALKLQADIQFKLLSKIIPDVKSMDHNIGDGSSKVNFIINLDGGATLKDIKEVKSV